MAVQNLPRNPVNYSDESRLRETIVLKNTPITTTGTYSVTSASSGETYSTLTGGEQNVLEQLDAVIGNSVISADVINDINKVHIPTVNSRVLEFDYPSWAFDSNRPFRVEIESDIAAGTVIQIQMNSDTILNLQDSDGVSLTELEAGYYTFIAKVGTPNFFLQAPSNGGNVTWLQQFTGANSVLLDEKEKEVPVKTGGYVYNEFSKTKLISDPSTRSLLHFEGSPGDPVAGTTVFNDDIIGRVWTAIGNAELTTTSEIFGSSSLQLDGSGDAITTSDTSDLYVGDQDFTVDMWLRRNTSGVTETLFGWSDSANTIDSRSVSGFIAPTNQLALLFNYEGASSTSLFTDATITDTSWHHVAFVKEDLELSIYIDGVKDIETRTVAVNTAERSTSNFSIGREGDYNNDYFDGYIDEFRFVVGEAKFNSNFTPPAAPYDVDVQIIPRTTEVTVELKSLLHMDGSDGSTVFTDESGTAWTPVGNAQIDTSTEQFGTGSALFDGVGDYIYTPEDDIFNVSDNDFTIDMWVRIGANGTHENIFGDGTTSIDTGSIALYRSAEGRLNFDVVSGVNIFSISSSFFIDNFQWVHVACVRTGNYTKLFVNGIENGTATIRNARINNMVNRISLGARGESTSNTFNGRIDEFRFINGEAKWGDNFTPPTAPYDFEEENIPNNIARFDGVLSMFQPEIDQVYQGFISNVNLWDANMEGQVVDNPLDGLKNPTTIFQGAGSGVGNSQVTANVTGSGWIVSIANGDANAFYSLYVDGSPKLGTTSSGLLLEAFQCTGLNMIRYESGFVLTENTTTKRAVVFYVEGDDFATGVPKVIAGMSATANTTYINVTGEGWFYGGDGPGGRDMDIEIDGVSLDGAFASGDVVAFFKFNTSLVVKLNATPSQKFLSYTLLP